MIDGDSKNKPPNGSEKDLALSINLNVFFGDETRSMHRRRTLLKIVTISTAIATSTATGFIIRRMMNYRDLSMSWTTNAGK
jgi:hypothetical protein